MSEFRYIAARPLPISDEYGNRTYQVGEQLPGAETWGYALNALLDQGAVVRLPVMTDEELLEEARRRGLLGDSPAGDDGDTAGAADESASAAPSEPESPPADSTPAEAPATEAETKAPAKPKRTARSKAARSKAGTSKAGGRTRASSRSKSSPSTKSQ